MAVFTAHDVSPETFRCVRCRALAGAKGPCIPEPVEPACACGCGEPHQFRIYRRGRGVATVFFAAGECVARWQARLQDTEDRGT